MWDYPRPPRLEKVDQRVVIEADGLVVADTTSAYRVLETASPPTFYLPPGDVRMDLLALSGNESICEWKGRAVYHDLLIDGSHRRDVAWSYPDPFPEFEAIMDYLGFYPGRVDRCRVGEWVVSPQPGGFYAGWVTPDIVGPFKGDPGTGGW